MSGAKPLRPKRRKAAAAADFTKVVADARVKVAKAKTAAFMARLDAIDIILEDVQPHDVLRLLSDCVVQEREFEDAAAAAEGDGGDAPRRVH